MGKAISKGIGPVRYRGREMIWRFVLGAVPWHLEFREGLFPAGDETRWRLLKR